MSITTKHETKRRTQKKRNAPNAVGGKVMGQLGGESPSLLLPFAIPTFAKVIESN